MKQRSFMYCALALIGIAMTACTANEEVRVSSDSGDVIGFSVETPNLTRAANSFCNNVTPDCFRVQAYDGAIAYFDQVDIVSKSGDKWQSNNDRYWPDDENKELTFYAYVDDTDMNYSGTMGNVSGGTFSTDAIATDGAPKFVNYEVNSVINQQRDLMYAVGIGKKADNAPVQLNFRHALSQICFTAENMDPSTSRIFITHIEVGGLKGKGTYTFPSATTEAGPDVHSNPAVDNPSDAKSGTWLLAEEVADPYVLSNFANNGVDYNTTESTPLNLSKPTSTEHKGDYVFDYAMNLIPQKIEAYFKVSFKKTAKGESTEGDEQSITIPVSVDWKEGMRYVYNLIWSRTGISYAVSFADYNEEESAEDTPAVNGYKKVLMRNAYTDDEGNYHAPLYFADRNVGASSPEEAGLFFWWGDTEGHYYIDGQLYKADMTVGPRTLADVFSEDNILTCQTSTLDEYLDSEDISDFNNYHLNLTHDAARLKMGGLWRMPEYDELDWLDMNSTWTKVFDSENIFLGYRVKSDDTGNEIFLPNCNDIIDGEYTVRYNTCYWSSSIYSEDYYPSYNIGDKTNYYSCGIYIEPNGTHPDFVFDRTIGGQIRAVCNR